MTNLNNHANFNSNEIQGLPGLESNIDAHQKKFQKFVYVKSFYEDVLLYEKSSK